MLSFFEAKLRIVNKKSSERAPSLESRQRKLPLSLQGGVFFKGHKSGHFSIQNDTLETKLINWFAEADLLNFLTHRDDI